MNVWRLQKIWSEMRRKDELCRSELMKQGQWNVVQNGHCRGAFEHKNKDTEHKVMHGGAE